MIPFKTGDGIEYLSYENIPLSNNMYNQIHIFEKDCHAMICTKCINTSSSYKVYKSELQIGSNSLLSRAGNYEPHLIWLYTQISAGDILFLKAQGENNNKNNYGYVYIIKFSTNIFTSI